jgi:beta-glucosidase-like glycosyl hydrolase
LSQFHPKILHASLLRQSLTQMSLPELASQLLMIRWDSGNEKEVLKQIRKLQPGGLILFGGDLQETPRWIRHFQKETKVPLLIGSDMERGVGQQIKGALEFPSQLSIGKTQNPHYAYTLGYHTAKQARALGVQLLFAPVADVNNNPENPIIKERAYGNHPETVARFCHAFIQGATQGKAISCAKHFPGHGDTHQDSHHTLPQISRSLDELHEVELVPFKACIQAKVPTIMTAHIEYPQLSSEVATVSPEILHQLLRKELGFEGVLISDALTMKGLADRYSEEEAIVRALQAGIDLLLIPHDPYRALHAILTALAQKRLHRTHLEGAVLRLLHLKQQFEIEKDFPYPENLAQEGQNLAFEMAYQTLMSQRWNVTPQEKYLCFTPSDSPHLAQPFLEAMGNSAQPYLDSTPELLENQIPVLFTDTRAYSKAGLNEKLPLLEKMFQHNPKAILLGYPQLPPSLKPPSSLLCTYSASSISQYALADFLQSASSYPQTNP